MHTKNLSAHGNCIGVERKEDSPYRAIGGAYGYNEESIYDDKGNLINDLTPTDEALANAKLWAAAPELLAALQGLIQAGHSLNPGSHVWNTAHAAIAKAGVE